MIYDKLYGSYSQKWPIYVCHVLYASNSYNYAVYVYHMKITVQAVSAKRYRQP